MLNPALTLAGSEMWAYVTLTHSDLGPTASERRENSHAITLAHEAAVRRTVEAVFGLFVSALEIPFPGNGDFGSKRPRFEWVIIKLEGRVLGAGGLLFGRIRFSL